MICNLFGDRLLLSDVSFVVKIAEHGHHHSCLDQTDPVEEFRVLTLDEEKRYHDVCEQQNKLDQLYLSDVLLPPNRLLHFCAVRSQEVIAVHGHVDETVEKACDRKRLINKYGVKVNSLPRVVAYPPPEHNFMYKYVASTIPAW